MEARLRLAAAGALAFLVAGGIFVALRGINASGVYLGESAQGVTSIPEPMFIAALVLTAAGFAYMVTGVALASPSVAIPGTVVIVGGVGLYTGAFGSLIGGLDFFEVLPTWARWTLRGLLLGIALLAGLAVLEGFALRRRGRGVAGLDGSEGVGLGGAGEGHRHGQGAEERALRLALLAAVSVMFGAYLLVLRAASPTLGGLNNFGPLIAGVMITIGIALYPILTVAAVDFAEWGEMASEFTIGRVERSRRGWVFPFALLCAIGLAVYAYALIVPGRGIVSGARIGHTGEALLIVVVVLAVIIAGGRLARVSGRQWPETLNFAALAAVGALATVIVPPIAGIFSGQLSVKSSPGLVADGHYVPGADVVTMASTGHPPFSALVPRGWLQRPGATDVVANDYLGGQQQVVVAYLPSANLAIIDTGFKITPSGQPVADGPWQMQSGSSPEFKLVDVWIRPAPVAAGGGDYLIIGRSNLAKPSTSTPLFEAVANSFSPAGSPLASPPPVEETSAGTVPLSLTDHTYTYGTAIEAGLSLLLLLLVRLFGRRWPIRFVGAVLLLGVVTAFGAAFGLDSIGRVVFSARLPALGERGLEFSLALVCVAALMLSRWPAFERWARPRWHWMARVEHHLPEMVIVLVGATFLLDGTGRLYTGMLSAGRVPVTAAILVLLASAWDIVMSGESMTNEGSPRLPRVTRVLAYFGYSILLSGMVLFYTAQKTLVGGKTVESLFEPESITQGGLFRVALPLLLMLLLLRLFGSGGEERQRDGLEPGGDGAQVEVRPAGVMAMSGEET